MVTSRNLPPTAAYPPSTDWSGSASVVGYQNSEDDTLPCTNSTAGPVRPATDSTPVASRPVGTRWALIPGSSVSVLLLRALAWTPARFPEPAGPRRALQKLAEIEVVSLKALQ